MLRPHAPFVLALKVGRGAVMRPTILTLPGKPQEVHSSSEGKCRGQSWSKATNTSWAAYSARRGLGPLAMGPHRVLRNAWHFNNTEIFADPNPLTLFKSPACPPCSIW